MLAALLGNVIPRCILAMSPVGDRTLTQLPVSRNPCQQHFKSSKEVSHLMYASMVDFHDRQGTMASKMAGHLACY